MSGRDLLGRAFVVGAWVVVVDVVIQVLLAGLGVFADAQWFFVHAVVNGALVFFLPIVLLLVGRLAGVPGRTLWLLAAVPVLVLVQSLLLIPYHMAASGPLRMVSGLHAANALVIFWVALMVLERTRAWSADRAAPLRP